MFVASCEVNLRKHIQREHNVIPQLDGMEEPIDDIVSKYKEKETQTDILDTKSVAEAKKIQDIKIEGSRLTAIGGHPWWFPCGTRRFEGRNMEGLKIHINGVHASNQRVLDRTLPSFDFGCLYCDMKITSHEAANNHWCWGWSEAGK